MERLRRFSNVLIFGTLAFAVAPSLRAVASDTSAVRLITPYPAGGPTDVIARVIAQPLSEELKRPVVVDNRAGASGTIGAGHVAKAAPDGSTLLINTSIHVTLPHLRQLPFDAVRDFTPLAQVNSIAFLLVVNKDAPFQTVEDIVNFARSNPGKLNYATNSPGGASHLAAELFQKQAGVKLTHIPYKGSAPAITDLIGGQVQLMFEQGPSVLPFLQSGQLRAIAATGAKRAAIAPDVPTFVEAGYPEFVFNNWQGIWGPAGIPADVKNSLVKALERTLQRPAVIKRLTDLGTNPENVTGDDFKNFVAKQYELLGAIVAEGDIKLQ